MFRNNFVCVLQRIESLQEIYETPGDVELLAGIWIERPMEGGYVPPTAACIINKQLSLTMKADRHWYERSDRPYAFNVGKHSILVLINQSMHKLYKTVLVYFDLVNWANFNTVP